jgi:hypothetical protein
MKRHFSLLSTLPIVFSLCGCSEGTPATQTVSEEHPEVVSDAISNGLPSPPQEFADRVIWSVANPNNDPTCSGSLVLNNWALTASHCTGQNMRVMYNKSCTSNADCARGTICTDHGWCGANVVGQYVNGSVAPGGGFNQVTLVHLDRPFLLPGNSSRYSIAQQFYVGTKASLFGKKLTIVGYGGSMQPGAVTGDATYGIFDVVNVGTTWSYITSGGAQSIRDGDSGGPGYLNLNGINYVTGPTVAADQSQHDIPEVYGWLDNVLFENPKILRSGAQALAMAGTANGAAQVYLSNGTYYYSQCDAEPCDSRGQWSTPGPFLFGGSGYAPAMAMDGNTAQVYVPQGDGLHQYSNIKGAFLGDTNLGGACAGPAAADSRPATNPPVMDVLCNGTDGTLNILQRESWGWNGWYSLGVPSGGIRSGTAPAVVSRDAGTTQVFVVGNDGQVWTRVGLVATASWSDWAALGGSNLRSVAATSYGSNHVDVIAVDSSGNLQHRVWAGDWNQAWTPITRGLWSSAVPPYAASYSGKLGVMNVGGIASGASTAYVQRFGDWTSVLPTTSITSPATGASFTSPASITINANAAATDATVTKVEFYQGTTLLGTDTTAPYSFNWTGVGAGSYALTTRVYDSLASIVVSSPVNVTVKSSSNMAPTTSITSPTSGATFTSPATITINANATDSDGSISKVEFYQGSTLIGTDTSAPYSVTWSTSTAGSYSFTSKAYDNQNATGTSGAVSVTVNSSGTRPCANLCTNPTVFAGPGYQSGNLGTGAICRETTANLSGGNCSNMGSRTLKVNGTAMTCSNWKLPLKRNSGYCVQVTAGTPEYASFATW